VSIGRCKSNETAECCSEGDRRYRSAGAIRGFILPPLVRNGCDRDGSCRAKDENYYFHANELASDVTFGLLDVGDDVEFEAYAGPRGSRARNVRPPADCGRTDVGPRPDPARRR
jgi:cold shock CspA family protein